MKEVKLENVLVWMTMLLLVATIAMLCVTSVIPGTVQSPPSAKPSGAFTAREAIVATAVSSATVLFGSECYVPLVEALYTRDGTPPFELKWYNPQSTPFAMELDVLRGGVYWSQLEDRFDGVVPNGCWSYEVNGGDAYLTLAWKNGVVRVKSNYPIEVSP